MQIAAEDVLGLIVVAEPELQAEDGAQRNELVEDAVIADGPGNAAENDDGDRSCGIFEPRAILLMRAIGEPESEKWEQAAERGVEHQRHTPEQAIGAPIAEALRLGRFGER